MINKIILKNFRNYIDKEIEFINAATIIYGSNGIGKTNILESIHLFSIGKSFRATREQDMINLNFNSASVLLSDHIGDQYKIEIYKNALTNRAKKVFKVNELIKTSTRVSSELKSVFFSPDDIRLINGSPSRRRDFLNHSLVQIDAVYHKSLSSYERILKQKNKYIEITLKERKSIDYELIGVWNNQLQNYASYIQLVRNDFLDFIDKNLVETSLKLFSNKIFLKVKYIKSDILNLNNIDIKDAYGPHRDDFEIYFGKLENNLISDPIDKLMLLKDFGSRGQQRTAVLSLKILEKKYINVKTSKIPLLLLDDIFSELDENYKIALLEFINESQCIITAADLNNIPKNVIEKANLIEIG